HRTVSPRHVDLARARVPHRGSEGQRHFQKGPGGNVRRLGSGGGSERTLVAAEVVVEGRRTEGVDKLGRHVGLGAAVLAYVLPRVAGDAVNNELVKDIVGSDWAQCHEEGGEAGGGGSHLGLAGGWKRGS